MRIHTDKLNVHDIFDALRTMQDVGHVNHNVEYRKMEKHTSRSHRTAYEIKLGSRVKIPGSGRQRSNSGFYGADTGSWAATHDEWGYVLAELYRLDPGMVCGSAKHPVYANEKDFREKTKNKYTKENSTK